MKLWVTAAALCGIAVLAAAIVWHERSSRGPSYAVSTPAPASLPEKSLYHLESVWTSDDDRKLRLRDLHGHFEIMVLMFTECPGTCPALVKELQMFAKSMPRDVAERTRFVLVSIDSERDSTEVLRRYRKTMGLDSRWTLLRGEPADIRELAAVLGFNYDFVGPERFAHSNMLTVLNPLGEIIHEQTGVGGDAATLIDVIRQSDKQTSH